MKIAVIFDSKTGNTKQAADWIIEGMGSVEGVEARGFSIQDVDEEYVNEAKGAVIGRQTRRCFCNSPVYTWRRRAGAPVDTEHRDGLRDALLFGRKRLRRTVHTSGAGRCEQQCGSP